MMFTSPDQIYENAIDKVMQILGNYVWPFQDIIVRKIYEKIGSARFVVLNASLTILHKKKRLSHPIIILVVTSLQYVMNFSLSDSFSYVLYCSFLYLYSSILICVKSQIRLWKIVSVYSVRYIQIYNLQFTQRF